MSLRLCLKLAFFNILLWVRDREVGLEGGMTCKELELEPTNQPAVTRTSAAVHKAAFNQLSYAAPQNLPYSYDCLGRPWAIPSGSGCWKTSHDALSLSTNFVFPFRLCFCLPAPVCRCLRRAWSVVSGPGRRCSSVQSLALQEASHYWKQDICVVLPTVTSCFLK